MYPAPSPRFLRPAQAWWLPSRLGAAPPPSGPPRSHPPSDRRVPAAGSVCRPGSSSIRRSRPAGLRSPGSALGSWALWPSGTSCGLRLFLFIFVRVTYVPAALLVGVWFLMQLVSLGTVAEQPSGGVAYAAHVGGFIFGSVMARLFEEERNPDAL